MFVISFAVVIIVIIICIGVVIVFVVVIVQHAYACIIIPEVKIYVDLEGL